MDSDRTLDISNAKALTSLWQEEERRLQLIMSNPNSSPEIRRQAHDRLGVVLQCVEDFARELAALETEK